MQTIRVSIVEPKQPIRSREILKFWSAINESAFIGQNTAKEYPKEQIKQKIKSVNRDLAILIKDIQSWGLSFV